MKEIVRGSGGREIIDNKERNEREKRIEKGEREGRKGTEL